MKLARLGQLGHEIPVVIQDDTTFDISAVSADIDAAFWETDGVSRVRSALEEGTLPRVSDSASLRVGAPVVQPRAIVCVGMNYAAHAAESGSEPRRSR